MEKPIYHDYFPPLFFAARKTRYNMRPPTNPHTMTEASPVVDARMIMIILLLVLYSHR
jgi:hypothetical protein